MGADPQYVFALATEVGPYMPAIAPQMRDFSLRIFNRLYTRVYKRIMKDWNLGPEDEIPFLIIKLGNLIVTEAITRELPRKIDVVNGKEEPKRIS